MIKDEEYKKLLEEKDFVFNSEIDTLNKNIKEKEEKIKSVNNTIYNANKIIKKNLFDSSLLISMNATLVSIALSVFSKNGITPFAFFRNLFLSIPLPNLFFFLKFKNLKKKLWYKNYPTEEEGINDLIVEKEIEEQTLKKRMQLDNETIDFLNNYKDTFVFDEKEPELDDESNGYTNIRSSRDISKNIYSIEAEIEKNRRLLDTIITIDYLNDKLKNKYSFSGMDERSLRLVFATITYALAPIIAAIVTGLISTVVVPIALASVAIGLTIGQINLKLLRNMHYSLIKKAVSLNLQTEIYNLGKEYEELCKKYDEDSIKRKIFELEYELMKERLELYHTSKKEEESLNRRKTREMQKVISNYLEEQRSEDGPKLTMKM